MKRTSPSSVDPVYFRPRVRASSAINAIPVVTVNRAFLAMGGKLAPRLRNPPACRYRIARCDGWDLSSLFNENTDSLAPRSQSSSPS